MNKACRPVGHHQRHQQSHEWESQERREKGTERIFEEKWSKSF